MKGCPYTVQANGLEAFKRGFLSIIFNLTKTKLKILLRFYLKIAHIFPYSFWNGFFLHYVSESMWQAVPCLTSYKPRVTMFPLQEVHTSCIDSGFSFYLRDENTIVLSYRLSHLSRFTSTFCCCLFCSVVLHHLLVISLESLPTMPIFLSPGHSRLFNDWCWQEETREGWWQERDKGGEGRWNLYLKF